MASFLNTIWKAGAGGTSKESGKDAQRRKPEPDTDMVAIERLLYNAGPLRLDGTDKFFGLENFGHTCYCNSILQALYHTGSFRESILAYPPYAATDTAEAWNPKVETAIRLSTTDNGSGYGVGTGSGSGSGTDTGSSQANNNSTAAISTTEALARRKAINSGQPNALQQGPKPEDKPDTPEFKKRQAMLRGPILELSQERGGAYGMEESTFTGLRDIFSTLVTSTSRTGVLSPQRFLEIFKRDNEMFRNSMHQDAHEFYGLVLNDIIANVEAADVRHISHQPHRPYQRSHVQNIQNIQMVDGTREKHGTAEPDDSYSSLLEKVATGQSVEPELAKSLGRAALNSSSGVNSPGTGWVHDIFEGILTSETKCLTCETTSQRDETFLDLSIDLEEHASVTSCLRKFSAEEMLRERNKFHCDHCGGLQEAEKRMKIKRSPKVMALHLKRFKYTDDYSRLLKLFHRVVYPYHLRMFNTTDDAEDPDRIYELYAVIVHIGGNAYHGHYVSVIKTEDRGWLLFDDEMVEPVDKNYVRNFFGDKPGMACAYVLFYQETTFEKVRAEEEAERLEGHEGHEGHEETGTAGSEKVDLFTDLEHGQPNGQPLAISSQGLIRQISQPLSPLSPLTDDHDAFVALGNTSTAPCTASSPSTPALGAATQIDGSTSPMILSVDADSGKDSKKQAHRKKGDKEREKKEAKAAEKQRKAAEKEEQKAKEKLLKKEKQAERRQVQASEAEELRRALEEGKKATTEDDDSRHRKDLGTATSTTTTTSTSTTATTTTTPSTSNPNSLSTHGHKAGRRKSMSRRSFGFLNKDKKKDNGEIPPLPVENGVNHGFDSASDHNQPDGQDHSPTHTSSSSHHQQNHHSHHSPQTLRERFHFGLGQVYCCPQAQPL